jgi:hypothetical protein
MVDAVPEEGRTFSDPDDFESQVREYVRTKALMKTLDARAKELNKKLNDTIDTQGYEDNDGNWILELGFDADGFSRLEKQRRVSRKLDADVAESIIDAAGIGDDVYEMVRTINEDALMAAFYEDKISEQDLDTIFPVTVSWALWTKK